MPENKDFALRIEIIDECLRNNLRRWTLDDIIRYVNEKLGERYGKKISRRSIQNDIRYMIEERGAPIERRKEGRVTWFYYADKSFSIRNLPIDDEEVSLLKEAIHILKQVNDFSILDEVSAIINKLENALSVNQDRSSAIIQFEKQSIASGTEYIDGIYTAVKEHIALKIQYKPFNADEPFVCICHPYLLKEYRNRWFVIGRKNDEGAISNFALDRILSLKPSSTPFLSNDLFDPETYFNNMVGVTLPVGDIAQEIEIKVAKQQAPYIRTKPIHFTQSVLKEYKDGSMLIRLKLINNYELRSILLGYAPDIQVLRPEGLRQTMKEIFQSALKND